MTLRIGAVVLAGGRGSRLGGADKAALLVGGRSLLDRTLDVLDAADPVVVVGPRRNTGRAVSWTLESPPGGGPLAGLRAGLRMLPAPVELVVVLATDHPHLTAETVRRLIRAVADAPDSAGAVLTDPDGAWQWLVGVWRPEALRRGMPEQVHGGSIRSVVDALNPRPVPAAGAEASDIDTRDDLRRSRDELGR